VVGVRRVILVGPATIGSVRKNMHRYTGNLATNWRVKCLQSCGHC